MHRAATKPINRISMEILIIVIISHETGIKQIHRFEKRFANVYCVVFHHLWQITNTNIRTVQSREQCTAHIHTLYTCTKSSQYIQ